MYDFVVGCMWNYLKVKYQFIMSLESGNGALALMHRKKVRCKIQNVKVEIAIKYNW